MANVFTKLYIGGAVVSGSGRAWKKLSSILPQLDEDLIEALIDFDYINNGDGTATLVAWKGTLNGTASTKIVIPDDSRIIL